MSDLRQSGLTPDEIESAIAADVETFLVGGGCFPVPVPGFAGPARRTIVAGGIIIEYCAVESPGGSVDVPTYYQL